MNTWTRIGLVVLRLVIGWHFLFEGLEKLESWYHGPREGQPVWSAEGYLRESQGPLAGWFRSQAGETPDPLVQLTATATSGQVPAAVEEQWVAQVDRFVQHYELGTGKAVQPEFIGLLAQTPAAPFPTAVPWAMLARSARDPKVEQLQLTLTKDDVAGAKAAAADWLVKGSRQVPSKLPGVSEKVKETTPQRIELYQKKVSQLREMEEYGMPAFDKDVWKDKYRILKNEVATMRAELTRDLNKPVNDALATAKSRLSKTQRELGPVPGPPAVTTNLDRINFVTRWGTALVGACLLMGFFTRTACVAGAGFLVMFFLAMPSLPWLPLNPRAEGHYLFINKNIIEAVALLLLATTQSGKWLGLDGVVQFLYPLKWRKKAATGSTR